VRKPTAATRLERLRELAAACRDCPLWANATQTVFGEGNARARLLVGEQPGDVEDRQGHPFVGPAGRILDQGLAEAGIDRRQVYVTNAVKHFKWEPRGKLPPLVPAADQGPVRGGPAQGWAAPREGRFRYLIQRREDRLSRAITPPCRQIQTTVTEPPTHEGP
jgi:hypothetical protein